MVLRAGCEEAPLEEGVPSGGAASVWRCGGRKGWREAGEEGLCGRLQRKIRGKCVPSGEQVKVSELCGISQLPHQPAPKRPLLTNA